MVESDGTFAALEAELTALAKMHITAFDSYVEVINDPVKGHFARYTSEQGNKLKVAKYRAVGFTLNKIREYYKKKKTFRKTPQSQQNVRAEPNRSS